jgi:hypothetical protein
MIPFTQSQVEALLLMSQVTLQDWLLAEKMKLMLLP